MWAIGLQVWYIHSHSTLSPHTSNPHWHLRGSRGGCVNVWMYLYVCTFTFLHLVIWQTLLSKATYKGDNSQAKSNKKHGVTINTTLHENRKTALQGQKTRSKHTCA